MRSEDNIFLLMWLTCSMGAFTITPVKAKVTTSCTIPSVEEGQQTTLTCTFGANISITQQDFKVEHYKMKSMEVTETVLECIWFDGKLECEQHSCCLFDNTVTFNLSLVILNATRDREGRYVCFALPSSPGTTEFCDFTLKESLTKEAEEEDSSSLSTAAMIVGIIVAVTVTVIIVTLLVCWKRCYEWLRKKKNTKDAGHQPTNESALKIVTENTTNQSKEDDTEAKSESDEFVDALTDQEDEHG